MKKAEPPTPPPCRLIESWVLWPSKRKEKSLTTEEKLAYAMATLEAAEKLAYWDDQRKIIEKALKTLKEN